MDLAEHYYKCGDYENALKCYTRIRDYCTSPKHLFDQCLDAINVGFQMRNYSTVQAYVSRANSAPEGPDKAAVSSKLKASAALYSLVTGKYVAAATEFLQIGPDLGSTFNEVLLETKRKFNVRYYQLMTLPFMEGFVRWLSLIERNSKPGYLTTQSSKHT
jgi:COP9 signalosome complex subunit 1